jgi:hypothetical protein
MNINQEFNHRKEFETTNSNHSNQFVITQMMKDKNGPYSQYPEPFKLSTPKNTTSKVIVDDFIKKQE